MCQLEHFSLYSSETKKVSSITYVTVFTFWLKIDFVEFQQKSLTFMRTFKTQRSKTPLYICFTRLSLQKEQHYKKGIKQSILAFTNDFSLHVRYMAPSYIMSSQTLQLAWVDHYTVVFHSRIKQYVEHYPLLYYHLLSKCGFPIFIGVKCRTTRFWVEKHSQRSERWFLMTMFHSFEKLLHPF